MRVDGQKLYPVYANVYDVTGSDAVKLFNVVFAYWWAPVNLSGNFHVGAQIGSTEWAWGRLWVRQSPVCLESTRQRYLRSVGFYIGIVPGVGSGKPRPAVPSLGKSL